jgi:ribonuclease P protein component
MFPRSKRVARAAFPALQASRRRVFSPHFSATLADTPAGVAVVVAKRVVATSVGRHLLKRRILAILRSFDPLPAPGIIVFAKAGASGLSRKELLEELKSLLL